MILRDCVISQTPRHEFRIASAACRRKRSQAKTLCNAQCFLISHSSWMVGVGECALDPADVLDPRAQENSRTGAIRWRTDSHAAAPRAFARHWKCACPRLPDRRCAMRDSEQAHFGTPIQNSFSQVCARRERRMHRVIERDSVALHLSTVMFRPAQARALSRSAPNVSRRR